MSHARDGKAQLAGNRLYGGLTAYLGLNATCGKQNVHHLEREDLVALTVEAAAMAGVLLAGTDWVPGRDRPLA